MISKEKIMELLKEPETYDELKRIGFIRDEIWLLRKRIDNYEYDCRELEAKIQAKHKLDFQQTMALAIMADRMHREMNKK